MTMLAKLFEKLDTTLKDRALANGDIVTAMAGALDALRIVDLGSQHSHSAAMESSAPTSALPDNLLAQCGDGQEGGEMPPSADDEPQHAIRTAATASPAWREARDQYIGHLMACRACYAPNGRHCAVGAELRAIYDSTPWT